MEDFEKNQQLLSQVEKLTLNQKELMEVVKQQQKIIEIMRKNFEDKINFLIQRSNLDYRKSIQALVDSCGNFTIASEYLLEKLSGVMSKIEIATVFNKMFGNNHCIFCEGTSNVLFETEEDGNFEGCPCCYKGEGEVNYRSVRWEMLLIVGQAAFDVLQEFETRRLQVKSSKLNKFQKKRQRYLSQSN